MLISDLHIHGKYSQATSKNLDIPNLEKYARLKGVDLLGTGDFTHPKWFEHLKESLVREENGVYYTKNDFPFILTTEISLIYSQGGRGRRVHNLVFAPSLDVVKQITDYLLTKGRVDYDGRPIFKISCMDFVEDLRKISDKIEVIPAHIWTPWFGLLGSKSGFDSVEEAFGDQVKHVHALETGLSSDPPMNWRLSQLDNFNLVSFSDLHSYWPWRLGREATVFDFKLSYDNLLKAIRTGEGLKETIEVDPCYGKYHWDGHRACNVCLSPKETRKMNGVCPKCGKDLTVGVEYRVEELADREEGFKPKESKDFKRIIPLSDLLSLVLKKAVATKTVSKEYDKILNGNSEYDVLLRKNFDDLKKLAGENIANLILRNRKGAIKVQPGYDGVYGVPLISGGEIKKEKFEKVQKSLGDF